MLDEIRIRLRQEIDRSGLSLAAASRAAGEPSPQHLKDVVSGRQKCTADLLAKLISIGVDSGYVLGNSHQSGGSSVTGVVQISRCPGKGRCSPSAEFVQ